MKSDHSLLPITVIILTHNEEQNLPDCLRSVVGRVAEVHVVDSGSTDGTLAVANEFGISVHTHPFAGFGQQRNWAIDNVPYAHRWTFHLDADERMTPELCDEIRKRLDSDPQEAGFFVASKLMLDGRWLRYSSGYPVYQVRLFHRERLRFTDHGHGQREITDGTLGYLDNPYIHDAYRKGLDDWFAKHAVYARREADLLWRERPSLLSLIRGLFASDRVKRRRALKLIAYSLPFRPTLRLFQLLILNRGLLDGGAGIVYAHMTATYESMMSTHRARLKSGVRL